MFPLHRQDELCFQIFSHSNYTNKIPGNLVPGRASLDANVALTNKFMDMDYKNRRRKVPASLCCEKAGDDQDGNGDDDGDDKRKKHREIEKQRRQEMANLHATLRSVLPLELIRGKRSMSDHMNEAANYIKHMKKKIKELRAKRDELSSLDNSRIAFSSTNSASSCCLEVNSCLEGVEIVISHGIKSKISPLSTILERLFQEGLDFVNCLSTRVNDRIVHTIQCQCQASAVGSFHLSELKGKLKEVITPS